MKEYKALIPEFTLKSNFGNQKKVKITNSKDAYELFISFFDTDTIELVETFIVSFALIT